MREIEIRPISVDGFSARGMCKGRTVTIFLKGEADSAARPHFDGFLKELHALAQESSVSEVFIDIRDLEFLTSSCFKDLITWINLIKASGAQSYRLTFIHNPTSHWQKRSLQALRCFATELITIRE